MGFILKLLGLVDLAAAALLFLDGTVAFPWRIILMIALCLGVKAAAFWGGPVSGFDLLLGAYLLLTPFTDFGLLNALFGAYLVIKGVYSFA